MTCGIYMIANTLTGDRYIGSSINIESRLYNWRQAFSAIAKNSSASYSVNKVMYKAVRFYGVEAFEFSVLQECEGMDGKALRQLEKEFVERLRPSFNILPVSPSAHDYPVVNKYWNSKNQLQVKARDEP